MIDELMTKRIPWFIAVQLGNFLFPCEFLLPIRSAAMPFLPILLPAIPVTVSGKVVLSRLIERNRAFHFFTQVEGGGSAAD